MSNRPPTVPPELRPPLPPDLEAYRRTPIFDEATVPRGLLHRHTTKVGVWGRIEVLEGEVLFRVLEPIVREERLSPSRVGIVEPEVPHEVELVGPVRFFVQFLRVAPKSGGIET